MTKHSLNFRSTAGAWGEVAPAGAVLGNIYPASIAGLTCGWSEAPAGINDYAGATNAKLSGRNAVSSSVYFRVDLPEGPGRYRLWAAFGHLGTTTSISAIIRDGAGAAIATLPSTSVTGNATAASAQVMDASGAVISYSTYVSTDGGTYIEFVATSDHIRIERVSGSMYINNLQIEIQAEPLVDAVLSTEFGTGAHSGTIWAKEPAGKAIGRVSSVTGLQNFAIIGAAATYFAIETRGAQRWLVTTQTRIPDGWSGTITIRQTSGEATHDTAFALTATAIDRPVTGLIGLVSSQTFANWMAKRAAIDAIEWPGYQGEAFVSDQAVTSGADLVAKMAAITPNGGWYRLRLQDGAYTGNISLPAKDFGAGGLLLQPDTGHNPELAAIINCTNVRKMEARDLRGYSPDGAASGRAFSLFEAHATFTAPYALLKFKGVKFGKAFSSGGLDKENHSMWRSGLRILFAEQLIVEDCEFDGVANAIMFTGGHLFASRRNNRNNVRNDFHAVSPAFNLGTPSFDGGRVYMEFDGNTAWNNPDIYTGLGKDNTPHSDEIQFRSPVGAAYLYGPYTRGLSEWTVSGQGGDSYAYVPSSNRWYKAVAKTTGVATDASDPPTGTGTGIVKGGVTFDFLSENTVQRELHLIAIHNALMIDGVTTNQEGNVQPNVQFIIDSGMALGNSTAHITAFNNISASSNTRGIRVGDGFTVDAEFNSFVGGAQKILDNDQAQISGPVVRARANIVGLNGSSPFIEGTTSLLSEGNVGANFKVGAASPNRPGDVLAGPFTFDAATGWSYPDFVDNGSISADELRSNLSKRLHHLTGAAGAKLREVHTVTLSGAESGTISGELVIEP